jgi:hypothetical protein
MTAAGAPAKNSALSNDEDRDGRVAVIGASSSP